MRGLVLIPPDTKIRFMAARFVVFAVSTLVVIGSLVLVATKGLNLGIDFRGGILLDVRTQGPADLSAMRATLNELGLGEVALQEFGAEDTVLIRVRMQEGGDAAQNAAMAKIKQALGSGVEYRRTEVVGPQVSAELLRDGIYALIGALLAIMAYVGFRFEWQFGVTGVIATAHDVVSILGLYSLLGLEFNLTSIAALMTIAGYSINDTVVVFDRVRENMRKYKAMPLPELFDLSINQTLSRTVLTSGATLLSLLALYFLGGEVLHGFSLAVIWGIIFGTYSSICVATPMLLYMNVRRGAVGEAAASEAS
jgi:preprotein translocase subunit SecF